MTQEKYFKVFFSLSVTISLRRMAIVLRFDRAHHLEVAVARRTIGRVFIPRSVSSKLSGLLLQYIQVIFAGR